MRKRFPSNNATPEPGPRAWPRLVGRCVAVFVAALAVRILVLITLAQSPFFAHPVVDAQYHDGWARSLAADQLADTQKDFLRQPYFKPPFYAWVLGAWYRVFGRVLWQVKTMQAVLGALGCVAVYLMTLRLFGSFAAWGAAGLAALYWPWIFFDAWLLNTELVIFLDLSAALLLLTYSDQRRAWLLVPAGLLMGCSAITWPTGLLISAGVAAWLVWLVLSDWPMKRRWLTAAVFLAAAALPVLGVALRNGVVGGDRVLISSNGGVNLYTGARPEADGLSAVPTGLEWERLVRETAQRGIEKPSACSRYWAGRAIGEMAASPWRNFKLTVKRAVAFFNRAEPRNNLSQAWFLEQSPWLRVLPGFALLGPLWFAGLAVWVARLRITERRKPFVVGAALCLAFVAARWVSVWPFFVCDRFRVVAVPFMLPFAGLAMAGLLHTHGRRFGRGHVLIAALAAAFFVIPDWCGAQRPDFSREHLFLGRLAALEGRLNEAESELRESLSIRSNADAWVVLSHVRMGRGDYAGAVAAAHECLELMPDAASAHSNCAASLLKLNDAAEALAHADEAVRLEPKKAAYRLNRAATLIQLGRMDKAQEDLRFVRTVPVTPAEVALYRHLCARAGLGLR